MAAPAPAPPPSPNQPVTRQQQELALSPSSPPPPGRAAHRGTICKRIGQLVLWYLLGPTPFLAQRIKAEAAAPTWDARERQKGLDGSAFLFLLLYIPLIVFRDQVAWLWTGLFFVFTQWTHLPLLDWLGQAAIWPPTLSTMLYRWSVAVPATQFLAWILYHTRKKEQGAPAPRRILLPQELTRLPRPRTPAAQKPRRTLDSSVQLIASSSRRRTSTGTRKARKTGDAQGVSTPIVPPANSLWGQVRWDQVPDTDPLKQAALQEAGRLRVPQSASERNGQRTKRLTPSLVIAQPKVPTSPAPPKQPDSLVEDMDGYDWHHGEGSLKL